MTSTAGVNVGDYVFGTNIGGNAKVVSITNGTTIVVDTPNIGTVSGTLSFTHLPNETISPSLGFDFKVRIVTAVANATPINALAWYTKSDDASRAYQYPLDTVNINVTAKDLDTGNAVVGARVIIKAGNGGPATPGTILLTGVTNASGFITGTTQYINQPITGVVRRATASAGTLYKPSAISGTIGASGIDITTLMIKDE
jgi:hypothetical protein